jgi:acetyl esterase
MDEHLYRQVDRHELKLQVFTPDGPAPEEGWPAIIFFFGGGFVGGTVEQFRPHCEYLAGRGMVGITADYRVKDRHGSTPPDSAADGRAAIRWVRAHAGELGIDPNRIAAGGGSAGGGVAACAGLIDEPAEVDGREVRSRADALVLFGPVLLTAPIDGCEIRPAERVQGYRQRWGREAIEEISACHLVNAAAPPTLILHGEVDTVCPLNTIHPFVAKMHDLGVRCDLVTYPDQGHGFFNYRRPGRECFRLTLTEADRFLTSLGYLQGESSL